jgi:hypothetical protein
MIRFWVYWLGVLWWERKSLTPRRGELQVWRGHERQRYHGKRNPRPTLKKRGWGTRRPKSAGIKASATTAASEWCLRV